MKYEAVIGLEIHIQLKTQSKMFAMAKNVLGDAKPNTAIDPVVMGHPGTLPVLNKAGVEQGIKLALALHCDIASLTKFDRKNYFYPDLPKGYQISQFDLPLGANGHVELGSGDDKRTIHLERLHLEEDAGKNIHDGKQSLVDFNRAGTPLAEIVTKPDFRTASDAKEFLQELRLIARYCGVSDADMEKGHLRCDANISLRPKGDAKLYPKTEVKNLNSFKSVEKALLYEIDRQAKVWDQGGAPEGNETRGWDEAKQETVAQRRKEGSHDYRYFPEPDLPPLEITSEDIEAIRKTLPELPEDKRKRFIEQFSLSYDDANLLIQRRDLGDYFEQVVSELREWYKDKKDSLAVDEKRLIKYAHSWITSELLKHLNADGFLASDTKITPENFAELVTMIAEGALNSTAAQTVLEIMYNTGNDPSDVAEDNNLLQENDEEALLEIIDAVIKEYPKQVAEYKSGKEAVLKFLIGQVMRASKGSANPQVVEELFKERLS